MNLRSALFVSALAVAGAAHADTLTSYSFESLPLGSSAPTSTGSVYSTPSDGGLFSGTASGSHALATTVYSGPAGNGSAKAFSANMWTVGDYYQFTTSATGYKGLTFSFDQTGSSTGPMNFGLYYSTNGTTSFTQFSTYSVLLNGATGLLSWGAGNGQQSAYSYSFDLSGISGLNNQGSVAFRLVDLSTTSVGGGTVGTGGTSRVDNVTISGTPQAVPEPSAFAALGLGALALVRRRRSAK